MVVVVRDAVGDAQGSPKRFRDRFDETPLRPKNISYQFSSLNFGTISTKKPDIKLSVTDNIIGFKVF
jgi:hypothetical protein